MTDGGRLRSGTRRPGRDGPTTARRWLLGGGLALVCLSTSGCGLFELDTYDGFGDWYVGRSYSEEPEGLVRGVVVESWEGTAGGYIVNDLVIRTPVYFGYEVVRTVLIPVALPWYGVQWLLGPDDRGGAIPPAPAPADG